MFNVIKLIAVVGFVFYCIYRMMPASSPSVPTAVDVSLPKLGEKCDFFKSAVNADKQNDKRFSSNVLFYYLHNFRLSVANLIDINNKPRFDLLVFSKDKLVDKMTDLDLTVYGWASGYYKNGVFLKHGTVWVFLPVDKKKSSFLGGVVAAGSH